MNCVQNKRNNSNTILPKKVALGELYAKYSLFDAHAGNSFCFKAPPSPSSSTRFHGNCDSIAVGVVTRVSPDKNDKILLLNALQRWPGHVDQFRFTFRISRHSFCPFLGSFNVIIVVFCKMCLS